jgi:hypothetical protein
MQLIAPWCSVGVESQYHKKYHDSIGHNKRPHWSSKPFENQSQFFRQSTPQGRQDLTMKWFPLVLLLGEHIVSR